jgi:NitT/TauT family transport system substrate-binding protein
MGYFRGELPQGVQLDPVMFTSDAQEASAFASGKLDAAYVDPVTAVHLWQSSGDSAKIVAGAASGGAELVAGKDVTSARQLAGKMVAVQAGSAQAVALSSWLHQQGISATSAGASDEPGPAAVRAVRSGTVAAAWEPAPFDVEMAADGGHVLAAENPAVLSATAELVVSGGFLAADPSMVTGLLKGQILANNLINTTRPAAQAAAGDDLASALGRSLPSGELEESFAQVTATNDPLVASVLMQARQAAALGILRPVGALAGLYDLTPINKLLRAAGQSAVS